MVATIGGFPPGNRSQTVERENRRANDVPCHVMVIESHWVGLLVVNWKFWAVTGASKAR
jgi:hypothetical protein